MMLTTLIALTSKTLFFHALLAVSAAGYAAFWIWGMVHASSTPKASPAQRVFWAGSMFVNPSMAVWYWYIWKRWAFWLLFTPIFGLSVSLPFVVRSLLSRADATKLTNALFALGTQRLVVLVAVLLVFPLILRLAALLHLGRNTELSAMQRNDWVVGLALPVFGYGAGLAYCARYRRVWALVSIVWWIAVAISLPLMFTNIARALIPAGEERREEFRTKKLQQSLEPLAPR